MKKDHNLSVQRLVSGRRGLFRRRAMHCLPTVRSMVIKVELLFDIEISCQILRSATWGGKGRSYPVIVEMRLKMFFQKHWKQLLLYGQHWNAHVKIPIFQIHTKHSLLFHFSKWKRNVFAFYTGLHSWACRVFFHPPPPAPQSVLFPSTADGYHSSVSPVALCINLSAVWMLASLSLLRCHKTFYCFVPRSRQCGVASSNEDCCVWELKRHQTSLSEKRLLRSWFLALQQREAVSKICIYYKAFCFQRTVLWATMSRLLNRGYNQRDGVFE